MKCVSLSLLSIFFHYIVADNATVYKIQPCDANTYYPVIVNNVIAEEKNRKIFVSGSLSTDDELIPPISASLTVKRYVKWMKSWFPLACIDGIGSCTYDDLCSYGISQNKSCPDNFVKNNVPCRCPILEGTYIMQPLQKMYLFTMPKRIHLMEGRVATPIAGTYWIKVAVRNNKNVLSCYDFYIDYQDETLDLVALNEI